MRQSWKGKKVLVMGLGRYQTGSGVSAALYALKRGAELTVSDLRSEDELKETLQALADYQPRLVLGRHDEADFREADLVIKNPAVPSDHPYLALAARVETDISLFLAENTNPLLAITGSKGKSSTAFLLYQSLLHFNPQTLLGGNLMPSPLVFLDGLDGVSPVVLELSSWQLASLKNFQPHLSALLNLYHDHQNTYKNFRDYVADKAHIFEKQTQGTFFCQDQAWYQHLSTWKAHVDTILIGQDSPKSEKHKTLFFEKNKAFLKSSEGRLYLWERSSDSLHFPINELFAGAFLWHWTHSEPSELSQALRQAQTLPHRREWVRTWKEREFYNDSAATLPEASVLSVLSFPQRRVCLIVGGTDKELDFMCFNELLSHVAHWILLEGSATKKIQIFLQKNHRDYSLETSLEKAISTALRKSSPGDVILFSPASASFELFENEFHRGDCFKNIIKTL